MDSRIRRITKEIQQFMDDPPDHIYIDFDEQNVTHLEVLIIGPRLTPYSRMFMRLTIDYPADYPIKPPKIVFSSHYNRKIHPNIFPGGWICLSTLEAGNPAGWVPSINLGSVLTTIYSMFTKEMIMIDNTHVHEKDDSFFPGIMWDTFYITSRLIVEESNPKLSKIMRDYVLAHKDWYIRKLTRLSDEYDGKMLPNFYEARVAQFKELIPIFRKKY